MILALFAVGVVLLVLPGRGGAPPRHLPLAEWVPLAVASMVSGMLAITMALVFVALPPITHTIGGSGVLHACHEVLVPFAEYPTIAGWLALVAVLVLVWRACTGVIRSYRHAQATRPEAWLGRHTQYDGFELVVLPTDDLLAFGVPGRPRQVVISEGVARQLEPAALGALIHHEAAHHRLHHARYLAVLAGIEHALGRLPVPQIRRSASVIRDALEQWADSQVARTDANVPALCHALTASGSGSLVVSDRVDRLTRPVNIRPVAARALAYVPTSALSLASVVLALGWITNSHVLVPLGIHCT